MRYRLRTLLILLALILPALAAALAIEYGGCRLAWKGKDAMVVSPIAGTDDTMATVFSGR